MHVAGFDLGLVLRLLLGAGTPKELAARGGLLFHTTDPDERGFGATFSDFRGTGGGGFLIGAQSEVWF